MRKLLALSNWRRGRESNPRFIAELRVEKRITSGRLINKGFNMAHAYIIEINKFNDMF